ncbi:MAG TPA: hypothetical protein VKT21_05840 [Thermoplasmata archaeon]|nr:hypothetical protein [Thermoplasmata archaeon]
MAFSHRDHRARRELRQLYLALGAGIGVLTLIAILFPNTTVRLLAIGGLAVAGAAYVIAVDRLTEGYLRDLSSVRSGEPISGEVRAEVYHEVGFERDREDDRTPSPHHRRPGATAQEPTPDDRTAEPAPTWPARSDPASDEA